MQTDVSYLEEQASNLQNDAAYYRQRARKAEADLERYQENYAENQEKADEKLDQMRKRAEKAEKKVDYMQKNDDENNKVTVALVTASLMYMTCHEYARKLEDKVGDGWIDSVDDRLDEKASGYFDQDRMHTQVKEIAKLFGGPGHTNKVACLKLTSADVSNSLVGAYAPEVDTEAHDAMDLHASDAE